MKTQLKIKTWNPICSEKSVLLIQIIEQPEQFRATKGELKNFKSSDGFEILSYSHPNVFHNCLYVGGTTKNEDDRCLFIYFDSDELREIYLTRLNNAIKEFNEKYI
jgi:hypothetical protein